MKKLVIPVNAYNYDVLNKFENIDSVYFGYKGLSARDNSYDLDDHEILKIRKKKYVAFNAYKDPGEKIIDRIFDLGVEGIITTSYDVGFLEECKKKGLSICLSVNFGLVNIWMLKEVLISGNYDRVVVPSQLEQASLKYIREFPQIDFEFISIGARCPFVTFFCSCHLEGTNSFCINGREIYRRMDDYLLDKELITSVSLYDNVFFKIEGRYDTIEIIEHKIKILNGALIEDY